jgi:ankyrin repeat protein
MIRALLTTTGLPIDHQNNAGETPLHLACFKGQLLAAEVLCESGASLHIKSHKCASALSLSLSRMRFATTATGH